MKKAKVFSPPKSTNNKKFSNKPPSMYKTINWVEYRNKFLSANKECYACGERSTVVDHIVSHKGDEGKFWDKYNFIPLCKKCHDTITGFFDRHNPPKTEEKLKWLNIKRLATGTCISVKVISIDKK
jgi:5-methylcytosine-specific restriction endonuclease McrA